MSKKNHRTKKKHRAGRRPPQPGAAPSSTEITLQGPAPEVEQGALMLKPLESPAIGAGPGKYRAPGHLVDIGLNASRSMQLELFSNMSLEVKNKLLNEKWDIEFKNSNNSDIKYTPGEYLMLFFVLPQLLHKKSQTTNPEDKETYYKGDNGVCHTTWNTPDGAIQAISPLLGVNEYEIARAYKGGDAPSGADMRMVRKILDSLEKNPNKRALISYKRIEQLGSGKDGKTREYTVARYEPLVRWTEITVEDKKDGKVISSKKVRVLALHYVYIDQIADKYINMPEDVIKRITEARGHHKIPGTTLKLILYLNRELSAKRYTPFIGLDTALKKFTPELILKGYKKDALEALNSAIETAKALGLITKLDQRPGVAGPVLYFHLNRNW